jgi:hypothetical protein
MRTGSNTLTLMIIGMSALVLAVASFLSTRALAPDVPRFAGRVWARAADLGFEGCPRAGGFRFWMGCTDVAPTKDQPKRV